MIFQKPDNRTFYASDFVSKSISSLPSLNFAYVGIFWRVDNCHKFRSICLAISASHDVRKENEEDIVVLH